MRDLSHENDKIEHTRRKEKGEVISALLSRAKSASENGYYIECLGILTIILEERIYSVNSKLIPSYPSDKSISRFTLGPLVKDFLNLYKSDPVLKLFYEKELVDYLDWYLLIRNNIFHNLIGDSLIQDSKDLKELSIEGLEKVQEFMNSTQRWKKHK